MGLLGRSSQLNIYAPADFAPVLDFFREKFGEGLLFEINFVPLEMTSPEIVYQNRTSELLAFPLNHRVPTFGFIIREKMPLYNVHKDAIVKYGLSVPEIGALKRGEDVVRPAGPLTEPCPENDYRPQSGSDQPMVIPFSEVAYLPYQPRSYAYCSDTAPFPELSQWVKGATLLYHEATFPSEMSEMAEKTHHSTTIQAASAALEAGVGRLVVGHYSSRFPSVDFYLDQIRTIFPESYLAHDGDVFEI
jgi:ribonuclease Z